MSTPIQNRFGIREDGIGKSILRVEDRRFLLGRGQYVADLCPQGCAYAAFLRSPFAHAKILNIDTSDALALPGVIAVLTGADMAADEVGPMTPLWAIKNADGTPMAEPRRWALARDIVKHAGEPVAVVIAETADQAQDATESILVEYGQLRSVSDAPTAMTGEAPQLHENVRGNIAFRFERGDLATVNSAFDNAAHVVAVELVNNRLICAAMEPRAVLAVASQSEKKVVVYCTTQAPHHIRVAITQELGLSQNSVRVVAPDVGGGFGTKGKHYPEETTITWAALRLRRPVKWIATRSESFLTDTQGRDHHTHAELALDRSGHFLALKVDTIANVGAYLSTFGASIPTIIYTGLLAGPYRTPSIWVRSTGVFTNTVPVDAYRGAGRPEACFVLERLADRAAATLGLDRAEIRRRNFIARDAMPYKTPLGPIYDCGDFSKLFNRALEKADYAGFGARRLISERKGKKRGIGFAAFVESSGVAPTRFANAMGSRVGFYESSHVRVQPDGGVQVMLGTHNHGQGHATTFAQIVASRLGVPVGLVEIIEGDTDIVPFGTGTFGSRSIAVGGSALDIAIQKVIAKGRLIAAHLLEADAADVAFADGAFNIAGTDKRISLRDVARVAYLPGTLPTSIELGLQETAVYDPSSFAWSNGAHLCEVEVDPETGAVDVIGYWSVDDIGTVINPMIADGQIHGGIAQGIGQALTENCVYEPTGGQLLSGSFMDYALPRARNMPPIFTEFDQTQPCTHNPLGAKGCGEAGSIGAPAAVTNAILDALAPLGVTDVEMPFTTNQVWQNIHSAQAKLGARSRYATSNSEG